MTGNNDRWVISLRVAEADDPTSEGEPDGIVISGYDDDADVLVGKISQDLMELVSVKVEEMELEDSLEMRDNRE